MELIDIGKTPVSDETPAGTDIRSDPVFETLSSEIEKVSSPSAVGGVDWKKIVEISSDIMRNRSKDLLVCSYLCLALIKVQGLKGMAIGVHIYRDTVTTFWENLFPPLARMRGRKNALEWWVEAVSAALEGLTVEVWPKNEIDSLFDDLDAIKAFINENVDDPPPIAPMISIVASHLQGTPERGATEISPVAGSQAPASAARSAGPETSTANVSVKEMAEDPDKALKQCMDLLSGTSTRIMERNGMDPLYFRLNRVVAWVPVAGPPPADKEGKTLLPPPDDQVAGSLRNLYQSENWKDLLDSAESRVTEFLFWLDLSRYVAESLEHVGQKKTSEEVAGETLLYVKRVRGLEKLFFSDGTPFADADTRAWLESLDGKGEGQLAAALDDGGLTQQIQEQVAAAETLAKDGKTSQALNLLYGGLNSARSSRDRFMWQIWFCRFLAQTKQARLSASHCRQLVDWVDRYRLEEWDPLLATEAFVTVLSSARIQGPDKDETVYGGILRRLQLLDPGRALMFEVD
jgi:type VI secretion system protein VasJ